VPVRGGLVLVGVVRVVVFLAGTFIAAPALPMTPPPAPDPCWALTTTIEAQRLMTMLNKNAERIRIAGLIIGNSIPLFY
jgi:hypothetical protein